MVAVFPMLMVLTDNYHKPTKKQHIITETQYFTNTTDALLKINCPNCKDIGGLFKGFYYIQCTNCLNCFLSDKDYSQKIMTE